MQSTLPVIDQHGKRAQSRKYLDSLEIVVIVNDELDIISHSPNPTVETTGSFMGIPLTSLQNPKVHGGATKQMRMDSICCGAHGLFLMITVPSGDAKNVLLFDARIEAGVFEKNVKRLLTDLGAVEHIHLSHYHRDHSGGLFKAIRMINNANPSREKAIIDVHPNRPDFRGNDAGFPIILEPDPSSDEIELAGGILNKSCDAHMVMNNTLFISGEIPRVTHYENGIPGGIRLDPIIGKWLKDEDIMEERFVMLVLGVPLYAVIGGYQLADADSEKIEKTVRNF
ncbi:uncharacterized protein BDR25DRAFT_385522 [Lindgomyces ingoldianus]|uniref:Uncharacterized protein n=1 Tax=Lindgomyces ingoldianus TaxID=673940 RepID=A0ACB6R5L7_9PLEO|nr:uncharacterized protein BDR25DRAFT_385522 [Lindgomyces ingoldianus]KAF2474070.1 hypothetical protein BDR25DRAFT_385522 [Lindgomyces ingoldianus]